MTYQIERNSADGGWLDHRALIDNYYLDSNNNDKNTNNNNENDEQGQS